jgi:putative RecB family exonuclease
VRDYLSVSQINTYLMCPRKYRYRYVDELEPESRSGAAAFGTAVHSALGWWFSERMADRVPQLEEALRIFRADWAAELAMGDLELDGKTPEELADLGEKLVTLFVVELGDLVPEASDLRVEVPLVDPRSGEELPLPLLGFLDFVAEGMVGEIKTAARKNSPTTWLFQLTAYAYAMRKQGDDLPRAKVVQLIKTKVPKLEVMEVEITEGDVRWFLEVTAEVYDAICAGAFFPNPGWMCPRCEYRGACRAWARMAA